MRIKDHPRYSQVMQSTESDTAGYHTYHAVTLRNQWYLWCCITDSPTYSQVIRSTAQDGSNSSSDSDTAVYRTVLRYSVAANSWSPVTNITTGFRHVSLLPRNSKNNKLQIFGRRIWHYRSERALPPSITQ
jgi:hypothetical protein